MQYIRGGIRPYPEHGGLLRNLFDAHGIVDLATGEGDVVKVSAVAAVAAPVVLGIGPGVGMHTRIYGEGGAGPRDTAAPFTHILVVNLEGQFVITLLTGDFVEEGDTVVNRGKRGYTQHGVGVAADMSRLHAKCA